MIWLRGKVTSYINLFMLGSQVQFMGRQFWKKNRLCSVYAATVWLSSTHSESNASVRNVSNTKNIKNSWQKLGLIATSEGFMQLTELCEKKKQRCKGIGYPILIMSWLRLCEGLKLRTTMAVSRMGIQLSVTFYKTARSWLNENTHTHTLIN